MTDYTKNTNFTAKDALPKGDPNKAIKGSDVDAEFDEIATASATKANKITSPTANNVIEQDSSGDLVDTGLATPSSAFVGISDTQTLTNKTIVAANNTITTAASGNLTSTELNAALAELQTDIDSLGGRGVKVKNSTTQTVSTSTNTFLTFDTEVFDTDSIHSTSSNTSRLTVPSGVSYVRLVGYASFDYTGSAVQKLYLYRNGGTTVETEDHFINPGGYGIAGAVNVSSGMLAVSSGDYFELMYNHNAGSSRAVTAQFSMEIIA